MDEKNMDIEKNIVELGNRIKEERKGPATKS